MGRLSLFLDYPPFSGPATDRQNLVMIVATSARVAVDFGAMSFSPRPTISPEPTAHSIASIAQPLTLAASAKMPMSADAEVS